MNKTLLPKLRFPEFENSQGWKVKMLGDICDILNNRRRPISSDNREKGSYPYYGASGIVDYVNDFIFDERLLLVGEDGAKWGAFEKTAFLVEGKYWVNNHAHVLKTTGVNDVLLENYLNMLDISPFVTGAAPPKLTLGKLKEIPVPVPNFVEEQQKIADCLTSLDDLIAAQSQKVEALQAYKKGLMQNLFPAEGETVPRLRFPEFQSAGDWEEKTIGELGDVFMCKRIFAEETNSSDGVPFFKIGTLGGKPDAFISKELFDEYKSKYNYPRKGEILITCSGTVGKCLAYDGSDAYYQDSNIVWIDNPTLEISNEFLRSVLLNVDWGSLNSTTITRIYMSDLRDLSILFPANQKEQQRITELLSALDEQISAQGEALAALKVHKKGLMQGLFPKETSEVLKTSEV